MSCDTREWQNELGKVEMSKVKVIVATMLPKKQM